MYPVKAIVSGVGRSGTTAIFKLLCKGLGDSLPKTFYEPFLWDVDYESYNAPEAFGTNEHISHSGITAHLATPLAPAPGSGQPELDRFLDGIFSDHCVVKFIRANARLDYIMTRHPETVLIGILRNPVSTLNSSIYQFSLFGDEYHRSDWQRFRDDFQLQWPPVLQAVVNGDVEYRQSYGLAQLAWWYAMNDALVRVCRKYPERSFLTTQEALDERPDVVCQEMAKKLGLTDFQVPAASADGERKRDTRENRLTSQEFDWAFNLLDPYFDFRRSCDVPGWKQPGALRQELQLAHQSPPAEVDREAEISNIGHQPVRLRSEISRLRSMIGPVKEQLALAKQQSHELSNELRKCRNALQESQELLQQNIVWRVMRRVNQALRSK